MKAAVPDQGACRFGPPVRFKIARTCYEAAAERSWSPHNQTGVFCLSRADDDIQPILSDFDHPVEKVEVTLHLRPLVHEGVQHRHHPQFGDGQLCRSHAARARLTVDALRGCGDPEALAIGGGGHARQFQE